MVGTIRVDLCKKLPYLKLMGIYYSDYRLVALKQIGESFVAYSTLSNEILVLQKDVFDLLSIFTENTGQLFDVPELLQQVQHTASLAQNVTDQQEEIEDLLQFFVERGFLIESIV